MHPQTLLVMAEIATHDRLARSAQRRQVRRGRRSRSRRTQRLHARFDRVADAVRRRPIPVECCDAEPA